MPFLGQVLGHVSKRMATLSAGSAVNIVGLKGRPELNGMRGTVLSFDADKGRYAVKLPSAEKILLKPDNLQQASQSSLLEPLADLEYDALLEGQDFGALRTTLLQATARPGAKTYASQLKGSWPFGLSPLCAIVSVLTSSEENSAPVVQQAADAIARICTAGNGARAAVLQADGADAVVQAMRGHHSRQNSAARAKSAEAAQRHMASAAPAAATEGEEPRVVDVTDGLAAASVAPPSPSPEAAAAAEEEAQAEAVLRRRKRAQAASEVEQAAHRAAAAAAEADGPDPASSDAAAHAANRTPPTDPLLVTRACCHALCNLANGDDACKSAVVAVGGARAIADAMKAAPTDPQLAKIGVGGFANIAGGDAKCLAAAVDAGGVELVVQAMRLKHHTVDSLMGDACLALANFACNRGIGPTAVCDGGGLTALIAAVHSHGRGTPKVREWAGAAFSNLAGTRDPDITEALVEAKAPKAGVTLLGWCDMASESDMRAARFTIGMWFFLGADTAHPEAGEACLRAGFVEAACKLMCNAPKGSPLAADAVEEACRAFANLAFGDNGARAMLREAGARRALTAAIDAYPTAHKVQEMGRALLGAISS